jgi:hypothetical protein
MQRRDFIKGTLVVTAAVGAGLAASSYKPKGNVKATTAEGARHEAYLDGVNVSKDCTEADDVGGFVVLHVRDANGKIILTSDKHDIEREVKFGTVRIECMRFPCKLHGA